MATAQGICELVMSNRQPRVLPDGSKWVGKKVIWSPHGGVKKEGTVIRMAGTDKNLAMLVQFGDTWPQLCYVIDLELKDA